MQSRLTNIFIILFFFFSSVITYKSSSVWIVLFSLYVVCLIVCLFTRARYQLLGSSSLSMLQTFPNSSSFSLLRSSSSSSLDEDSFSSSALKDRKKDRESIFQFTANRKWVGHMSDTNWLVMFWTQFQVNKILSFFLLFYLFISKIQNIPGFKW